MTGLTYFSNGVSANTIHGQVNTNSIVGNASGNITMTPVGGNSVITNIVAVNTLTGSNATFSGGLTAYDVMVASGGFVVETRTSDPGSPVVGQI